MGVGWVGVGGGVGPRRLFGVRGFLHLNVSLWERELTIGTPED